jgi:hypothetical protein
VLTGMLLHMIETAGPVYSTLSLLCLDRLIDQVGYAVSLVDDIEYSLAIQHSQIIRLTTRGGIERGPIEIHPPTIFSPLQNGRGESGQVAVGVVEALSHCGEFAPSRSRPLGEEMRYGDFRLPIVLPTAPPATRRPTPSGSESR